MKYNFDEIIDRQHTNAINTDGFRQYMFQSDPNKKLKYKDDELVRMWIADMEFGVAPPILDAIRDRLDRRILGYTRLFDADYYEAFSKWCKEKYDWHFEAEELVISPGVIPALYQFIEDLVGKDEKVLTMTPAYGHFLSATNYNKVKLVTSALMDKKGYFEIDFEDLERKASDPTVKVMILCNPHNPTGRVWTQQELQKIAEIVEKNDLWIISDEIHCDLLRTGVRHIPMGKIMPTYNKLMTCMSASKTFNLAGLSFSNIIIRDAKEREHFIARDKTIGSLNPLSIAGHQAAYEKGGEWLDQLKQYIDENFAYVKQFVDQHLPKAIFEIPEATYLAWVDLNAYFTQEEDLVDIFAKEGVLLESGDKLFVGNAQGYIRLNLAMPRSIIEEGLKRIHKAIQNK